jgi:hypothetical protein
MELELLNRKQTGGQKYQIKTVRDVAKLSFKNIQACCDILPQKKRNEIENKLSKSLTFSLAQLPHDVKWQVMVKMLDGDEISAQLFYKAPLFYAFKKYDEARSMIMNSSKKQKSGESVALFFRLTLEQQCKMLGFVSPSLYSKVVHDGSVVKSEEEFQEILLYDEKIQEDFLAGEEIALVPDGTMRAGRCLWILPATIGALSSEVFALTGIFACHCFSEPTIVIIALGSPVVGGVIGGVIGRLIGNYIIRADAKKIDA